MRLVLFIIAFLLGIAAHAVAEVKYELPLDRWCRVGQFLPVRVTDFSAGDVLSLPGCAILHVGASGIVPVMVIDQTWQLRALGPTQRLVVTTVDDDAKTSVDPNVVSIRVSARDLSPLLAWEAADEVVVGEADLPLLGDDFVRRGLAMGMRVRVRSDARPTGLPGWRKAADGWIIDPPFVGVRNRLDEDAYLPMIGWHPGRDAGARQRAVLFAAVFCIAVLAGSLLRVRGALAVVVGVSIIACAAFVLVTSNVSDIVVARGSIVVNGPELSQQDRWTYYAALHREPLRVDLERQAPVFASASHARALDLSIHQDAQGRCTMHATLDRKMSLATRNSLVTPWPPRQTLAPLLTSPLVPLARSYVMPGLSIKGETTSGFDWPTVILEAK